MRKRTISLVLALLMVFTLLPVAASADDAASGKCGENLTWTLSSAGELTISGTGAMDDYDYEKPEWDKSAIKSLVVEEGVTIIGRHSFEDCISLAEVKLPDTLREIRDYAFFGCAALKSIDMPDGVNYLGSVAFAGCSSLKSVKLPASIEGIWMGTFSGCTALTEIVIPDGVKELSYGAFVGCSSLKSVTIPASVKSIMTDAFSRCSSLERIYYGGSAAQWKSIEIDAVGESNSSLAGAVIYCADPADPFPDIQGWFRDSIVSCYLGGIVNGYPDGTFRPDNNVTRAQFILMLYNMCGKPYCGNDVPFTDSARINSVYENAICWGARNGIIMGYSDGTFRADENISRAQMATFAYRLLDKIYGTALNEFNIESGFTDASQVLKDYRIPVNVMSSLGIINGYPDGRFGPNDTATRGQAATIFVRIATFINANSGE